MAHEIETMMFTGETPWHGLGIQLDRPPTVEVAIKAAGLDWLVGKKKVCVAGGATIPGLFANVRLTDGAVLGTCGDWYKPLQNEDAFSWFNPFLESGLATIETAGSLRGGKRVWILAKIAGRTDRIVGDDTVDRYILLAHGHDGKMAVRAGFTPIRTVCANTLAMALADRRTQVLRILHSKNTMEALEAARAAMNVANASFEATAEQFRTLARFQINAADLARYVNVVLDRKVEVTDETDSGIVVEEQSVEKTDRVLEAVTSAFEKGRGNDMKGVRGTWWGAYNAVTEYLAHERGNDAGARLNSMWFGQGQQINAKALDVALEMATR